MTGTTLTPTAAASLPPLAAHAGSAPCRSIVQVVDTLDYGGLERLAVNLANRLAERGFRIAVCCLRSAGPLAADLDPRVRLVALGAIGRDARLARRLREVLLDTRADLVHGHNLATWWDVAHAADGQIAHVQTFHGLLDDGRLLRQRLKGRFLARRPARLTAVSRELAADLAGLWGISPSRFAVVENGVDTEHFSPRPRDHAVQQIRHQLDARFICATVASLSPAKSPSLWLEALRMLPPECGVLWVGDGPLRWELAEAARKLGLHRRFLMTGCKADVRPSLAAADAFVLTSRSEALPVSLLEAMASALPAVAPRVGAIPTLIDHQRNGMLYDAGDARGLAATVLRVCASASARVSMGAAARRFVCDHHSLTRMIDRYEALYRTYCGAVAANAETY